jgi:hypothetical protein
VLYYLKIQDRLSSLQWPLVRRTADQQHGAKVSDETKNPPEARRLWPSPERQTPTKAARHMAKNVRATLRGVGAD